MLGFVCLSLKKGKKCKVGIRFVSKHMQIVQWQVPFFPKQKTHCISYIFDSIYCLCYYVREAC